MKIKNINHKINYYNQTKNNAINSHKNHPAFSSSMKIGTKIKNLGLIVQEFQLKNIKNNSMDKCCLVYNKTNSGGLFSLYKKDTDKIQELSTRLENYPAVKDVLNKYNFYTIPEVLEKLKEVDYKTAQLYNDLRIAECGYIKISNNKEKEFLISRGYQPSNINDDFFFIEDYFYDKQKGYESSGRIVAIPLLKKLIDSKQENILAVSMAIGENKSSPINLYLRYGFKPYRITEEEILKHTIKTTKGERIDPKLSVPVYLPKNTKIHEIVKDLKIFDEIDKTCSNWF